MAWLTQCSTFRAKTRKRNSDAVPANFLDTSTFDALTFHTTNSLSSIHVSLAVAQLPHLAELDLSDNCLSALTSLTISAGEEAKLAFSALQSLNISRNRLTELPVLALPSLKKLVASQNDLRRVESFEQLPALECLRLSGNQLSDFGPIRAATALRSLFLDRNRSRTLPHFASLTSLERCTLRGNNISEVSDEVLPCPSLQRLSLRENKIQRIEEVRKLAVLEGLRRLTLRDNPVAACDGFEFEIATAIQSLKRINNSIIDERFLTQMWEQQREKWEAEHATSSEVVNEVEATGEAE